MFGDVAGRVRLNKKVEVAIIFVRGYGRVGADNLFNLAVWLSDIGSNRNMLADREA